jgi:two-component system, sensor histidine kinase
VQRPEISSDFLARLFPFYVAADHDLVIRHVGPSMHKLLPQIADGDHLAERFELHQPRGELTPATVARMQSWMLVFECRDLDLKFRGQIVEQPSDGSWLYLGSPWIRDPLHLEALGLTMSDFAVHDPVMDMLYMLHAQQSAIGEMRVVAADLARGDEALQAAHRDLEQKYRDIAELSTAREQFLANISHELRTPLHVIVAVADLLDGAADREQPELVSKLRLNATRLSRLVDDLFSVGGLEGDGVDDGQAVLSVRRILDERVARVRMAHGVMPEDIVIDVAGDMPDPIATSGAALHRAVGNLLDNAATFTSSWPVTVRARVEDDAWLVVEVANPGPVIDPGDLTRIFEPFHRMHDGARSRTRQGRGLGLAVARRSAHAAGGDIAASSSFADGTVFTLRLPLSSGAGGSGAVEAERRRAHVLVVEDDAVNQMVVTKMLDRLAYSYEVASGGEQALRIVDAGRFDLALVDLHMPGIDGIETGRRLIADDRWSGPLVALTADVLPETRTACMQAGFVDVLTKPLRLAALAEMLERVCTNADDGAE